MLYKSREAVIKFIDDYVLLVLAANIKHSMEKVLK